VIKLCRRSGIAFGLAMLAALAAHGANGKTLAVDLPAQPLDASLREISRLAQINVLFDSRVVEGLTAPALKGTLTTEEAVRKLTADAGLEVKQPNAGTITVGRVVRPQADVAPERRIRVAQADTPATSSPTATEIETVIVKSEKLPEAFNGGQVARGSRLGLLGNRDVMDTPFSTTGFTAQLIQDVGARSLTQVLVADPSVRFAGSGSQTFDTFDIRGFFTRPSDVTFDGLYGVGPPLQVAAETVERVELIKGPTALLGGMSPNGAVGGSVNLAPKRAGSVPLLQMTGMFYSDSQIGTHVDMANRFGSEQQFGVRFNAVYRDGDSSLDDNSQRSEDFVVGLDYVQGQLRLSGDLGYQERFARGVDSDLYLDAPLTVLPKAPAASKRFLQPWTRQRAEAIYGVARAEYEFGTRTLAYVAAGFNRNEGDYILSYGYPLSGSGEMTENFWGNIFEEPTDSAEAGIRTLFHTGAVEHQVALAATRMSQESKSAAFFDGTIDGTGDAPSQPSSLYTPSFIPMPLLQGFADPPKVSESTLSGIALADTLSMAEGKVLLTLGARLQRVETSNFDAGTGLRADSYDEQSVSPAAALVLRPTPSISLYANYMEGLTKGPTASAPAVNAGEIFAPYASEQAEVGVKLDRGTFGVTVAAFQISQPMGITDPETLIFDLDGEQRNRGIEASIFGEPIKGLRLLGGLMLLDAELTKTEGGLSDGTRAIGVSKVNATLGGEWSPPALQKLVLSARGTYASSFYPFGAVGVFEAPSWTRLDLGARYSFSAGEHPVTVRLNVENALDEAFWQNAYLYRGAPRAVLMSATIDF
jgi:iron complex outermembrane receptor protein